MREKIYNIPNLLSAYRLIISPFLIWLAISGNRVAFLILLTLNVITDIIDGPIARATKTQTTFGAKLDSLADGATYFVVATGIATFHRTVISSHVTWIYIYCSAFALPYLVSLIKFRKLPSLHLYSSKVGGVLDGLFVAYLFFFGYSQLLFISAIIWGIFSFAEMTAVLWVLDRLEPDRKGIFNVLALCQRNLSGINTSK